MIESVQGGDMRAPAELMKTYALNESEFISALWRRDSQSDMAQIQEQDPRVYGGRGKRRLQREDCCWLHRN